MMSKQINFYLYAFGFESVNDFTESVFRISSCKFMFLASLTLGTVASGIEKYLGVTPLVYAAFIVLLLVETGTGIGASLKKGNKVQSRKLSRMLVKMCIYTILIGILYTFSEQIPTIDGFGLKLNVFTFMYYAALTWINFQLILSCLENLAELDYKEIQPLINVIKKKLGKYISLKSEEK